jgi:hypothetical protein
MAFATRGVHWLLANEIARDEYWFTWAPLLLFTSVGIIFKNSDTCPALPHTLTSHPLSASRPSELWRLKSQVPSPVPVIPSRPVVLLNSEDWNPESPPLCRSSPLVQSPLPPKSRVLLVRSHKFTICVAVVSHVLWSIPYKLRSNAWQAQRPMLAKGWSSGYEFI